MYGRSCQDMHVPELPARDADDGVVTRLSWVSASAHILTGHAKVRTYTCLNCRHNISKNMHGQKCQDMHVPELPTRDADDGVVTRLSWDLSLSASEDKMTGNANVRTYTCLNCRHKVDANETTCKGRCTCLICRHYNMQDVRSQM